MEITIQEEKYNPFLKRKELKILVKHENEATPSKELIKNFLKEKFKVDDSQIKIDYALSKIGLAESLVKAKIYDEKIEVNKVEAQPVKSE
ncbi:MAG: 30S ribosomal protein S24e [Candidatus Aenigmatarchaeota archaeon]